MQKSAVIFDVETEMGDRATALKDSIETQTPTWLLGNQTILEVETLEEKGKEGNSFKSDMKGIRIIHLILPIKGLPERKPGFRLGTA